MKPRGHKLQESEKDERTGLGTGLWKRNPIVGTALGLCPALAVSYRVDNAIALGAAVFAILLLTAATMMPIGMQVPLRYRFMLQLVVSSALAAVAELLFQAYAPSVASRLGIYVPIIAVNCLVLGGAEHFGSRSTWGGALLQRLIEGLGFFVALLVISVVREVLGSGTITLFRMGTFDGVVHVGALESHPASLFGYAAGALIVLGYLQALAEWVSRARKERGA